MNDRNLVRGLFLAAIALIFGLTAMRYPLGTLSRAGPGLFPIMVAGLLLLIAVSMIVRSRFVEREPLDMNPKNIAILLGSLVVFALVSEFINMTVGIIAMVFVAALAGTAKYSVARNVKISLGLLAIAFAFQKLLGLNLPLY